MKQQPIVFIGGAHGAGKTTFSRVLASMLSASHVTAGWLIREMAIASGTVAVGACNKAVPDVDANQGLLLRALSLYKGRVGSGLILLDGHFSLLNADGKIVAVPSAVFREIGPIAVLVVEVEEAIICQRLRKRDGQSPPLETISQLVAHERQHSQTVCRELKIPMWTVPGDIPPEEATQIAVVHLRLLLGGGA